MQRDGNGRPAGSSAAQGSPTGAGTQDVVGQSQQTARQVADQAQDKTGQVAQQVKQQASSRLSGQIDRAAEGLGAVSQTLQDLSGQLRGQNQTMLGDYTDGAAEQVQRVAGYLRGKDLDELVAETERFARRQPVVFVAGAFGLGLVVARFLKSSGQGAGGQTTQPALPAPVEPAPPPMGAGRSPSSPG
jgi:hypothetical protein